MSRHAAAASTDPARVSPKITAGIVTGGALTALAGIAAAFLLAIPQEAVQGLGVWSAPVFVAIGAAGAVLAGYAKDDPARAQQVPQVDSPREAGDYASNLVDPADMVLTEDQALTDELEPIEDEQPEAPADDPVARLAQQVDA